MRRTSARPSPQAAGRGVLAGVVGLAGLATAGTLVMVAAGARVLTSSEPQVRTAGAPPESWGSGRVLLPATASPRAVGEPSPADAGQATSTGTGTRPRAANPAGPPSPPAVAAPSPSPSATAAPSPPPASPPLPSPPPAASPQPTPGLDGPGGLPGRPAVQVPTDAGGDQVDGKPGGQDKPKDKAGGASTPKHKAERGPKAGHGRDDRRRR